MSIEFDCSQCGKQLFAQEKYVGREIQCPDCGQKMSIPAQSIVPPPVPQFPQSPIPPQAPEAPHPPAPPQFLDSPQPPPLPGQAEQAPPNIDRPMGQAPSLPSTSTAQAHTFGGPQSDERGCPKCGAIIKALARRCRFCGEILDPGIKRELLTVERAGQFGKTLPVVPGKVDFEQALHIGMESMKKYFLLGAAMVVVAGLASIFISAIGGAIIAGLAVALPGGGSGGGAGAGALFLNFILQIFMSLVQAIIGAGFIKAGLNMADGAMGRPVEPALEDLFSGFKQFSAIVVANIYTWIITFGLAILAFALFFLSPYSLVLTIPVIYYALMRLAMMIPAIMDREVGANEAMRISLSVTSGNVAMLILTIIVASFITMLGLLALIVGILFTTVFFLGTYGALYRQVTST